MGEAEQVLAVMTAVPKIGLFGGMFTFSLAALPLSAQAQGTFQNLNFEQANPIIVPGTPYVTAASAFPYWTVTAGGVQETEVTENDPSTGASWVMLAGPGWPPLDGNYSVLLQGYAAGAAISQTGLIPASTQSLIFDAQPSFAGQPLEVLLGGQNIPFSAVGSGPDYTIYGANISQWAGQSEQLTFSALPDFSEPNNWLIDDISFSTAVVPEPNTVGLVLMAAATFGLHAWRTRRDSGF